LAVLIYVCPRIFSGNRIYQLGQRSGSSRYSVHMGLQGRSSRRIPRPSLWPCRASRFSASGIHAKKPIYRSGACKRHTYRPDDHHEENELSIPPADPGQPPPHLWLRTKRRRAPVIQTTTQQWDGSRRRRVYAAARNSAAAQASAAAIELELLRLRCALTHQRATICPNWGPHAP